MEENNLPPSPRFDQPEPPVYQGEDRVIQFYDENDACSIRYCYAIHLHEERVYIH